MKYVDKILLGNEKIIYKAKIDWFIFVPGFLLLLLAIYMYISFSPFSLTVYNNSIGLFFVHMLTTYIASTMLIFLIKFGFIVKPDYGILLLNPSSIPGRSIKFLIGIMLLGLAFDIFKKDPIVSVVITHFFFSLAINQLLKEFLYKISTELVVTSKRIIFKTGFIKRKTLELSHQKIESLSLNQSILGRIFNFGDINIYGTGGVTTPIYDIDNPLVFRNKATELIDTI